MKTSYYLVTAAGLAAAAVTVYARFPGRDAERVVPSLPVPAEVGPAAPGPRRVQARAGRRPRAGREVRRPQGEQAGRGGGEGGRGQGGRPARRARPAVPEGRRALRRRDARRGLPVHALARAGERR